MKFSFEFFFFLEYSFLFFCFFVFHFKIFVYTRVYLPDFGSKAVVPNMVSPESSATLATALAQSASVKNEPSLELAALDRMLLQLALPLSVTLAQEAAMEAIGNAERNECGMKKIHDKRDTQQQATH